jgi:hypothetical protein
MLCIRCHADIPHSPVILTAAEPDASVLTLPNPRQPVLYTLCKCIPTAPHSPRSPTCLSASEGAPWLLPWGLKWAPAEVQPLLRRTHRVSDAIRRPGIRDQKGSVREIWVRRYGIGCMELMSRDQGDIGRSRKPAIGRWRWSWLRDQTYELSPNSLREVSTSTSRVE